MMMRRSARGKSVRYLRKWRGSSSPKNTMSGLTTPVQVGHFGTSPFITAGWWRQGETDESYHLLTSVINNDYLFFFLLAFSLELSDFLRGQRFSQNSLAAHLPHISSGRRCRWPSQTSHEPPPASQEESLPLNADGSASCAHDLDLDVLKPMKKKYYISPVRRCSACTS